MTSLLTTLVSPMSGGTGSSTGVTANDSRGWQLDIVKKANIGMGEGNSVPETSRTQLCAVSNDSQPKNPRREEYGILLVVPVRIFGHEIRALIDSGATRCFASPAGVTKCGLNVERCNTFLQLGDGTKVLSKGRSVEFL